MFLVAGLVVSTAILTNPDFSRLSDALRASRDLFLIGPFRLIGDVTRMTNIRAVSTGLTRWFVPLVFGGMFLFLFASANPLIEKWVGLLDIKEWTAKIDLARALFWMLLLSVIWPFLHLRWRGRKERNPPMPRPVTDNTE